MWILHFLSDGMLEAVIYGILGLGFAATVISLIFINPLLRFFPTLAATYRLIQLASVAVFLLGVYLWGGYSTEMQWRERVAELEKKLALVEQQAQKQNEVIKEKIVYRDRVIKERGETQIQYVDREIVKREEIIKYIEQCPVPKVIVDEHNKAAIKDLNQAAEGKK